MKNVVSVWIRISWHKVQCRPLYRSSVKQYRNQCLIFVWQFVYLVVEMNVRRFHYDYYIFSMKLNSKQNFFYVCVRSSAVCNICPANVNRREPCERYIIGEVSAYVLLCILYISVPSIFRIESSLYSWHDYVNNFWHQRLC